LHIGILINVLFVFCLIFPINIPHGTRAGDFRALFLKVHFVKPQCLQRTWGFETILILDRSMSDTVKKFRKQGKSFEWEDVYACLHGGIE
jgi:hypothetical protein